MAKIDLNILSLGNKFVDLRDQIPGDSYNWSWVRSLSEVNFLAIHHSASDNQTPQDIANFHINNNGWGGIGYHFVIDKNGVVFYVGDISTARANVANLNEQVLGICLIGNFTKAQVPTQEQLDSAHKLCEFFIKNYDDLANVTSWDKVRGHKELPGQSTNCPGDNWSDFRIQIVEGVSENIKLQSQVSNLQDSLAVVNQQLITLKEILADREKEVSELKQSLASQTTSESVQVDTTLSLVGALINLYQFLFPPREVASIKSGVA